MTRSARTLSFVTTGLFALVAAGCDLDPESVGDEDTGGEAASGTGNPPATTGLEDTGGATSADDGGSTDAPSDTGMASTEDDGEVVHEWDNRAYHYLVHHPDGYAVALGTGGSDAFITFFDPEGSEPILMIFGSIFQTFAATDEGTLVVGGGSSPADAPLTREAFLWRLDDDGIPSTAMILAEGDSFLAEIAVGGGTLWTLTAERERGAPGPRQGVLRRHGPGTSVELTHSVLAPAEALAVDSEGFAYTITTEASPQLRRVAPDGSLAWSVPLEIEPTGRFVLAPRSAELGVVIVSAVEGGRHVQEVDGEGGTLHTFVVPAEESTWPPASDVGSAIFLGHAIMPDSYVVEARSLDGTQLWSATRSVPGGEQIRINDVLETPDGAMVVGQVIRDSVEYGFARFIVAP